MEVVEVAEVEEADRADQAEAPAQLETPSTLHHATVSLAVFLSCSGVTKLLSAAPTTTESVLPLPSSHWRMTTDKLQKCTANSGVLNGNTINVCVLGGILGPCTASQ